MSSESIRCVTCGAVNAVTAFACEGCGASLVGQGGERWASARERDAVLEEDAAIAAQAARRIRLVVAAAAGLVVVAIVASVVGSWYSRNHYWGSEPEYDGKPAAHWVDMLGSPDHYLRRRAALAIESICERFNERTATEVVPALKAALYDEDEVVRARARTALDKIAANTGVT